jgi:carbon-monoxide dehydrogenase large subunit
MLGVPIEKSRSSWAIPIAATDSAELAPDRFHRRVRGASGFRGRTIDKAKGSAKELEVSPADIEYAAGMFKVAGTDLSLDLFTLAGHQPDRQIFVDSTSTVSGPTWPNGCHITEVEIDPPTGDVSVVRYASVNDVGRVVNPLIVRGQLEGGAMQGIGWRFTNK